MDTLDKHGDIDRLILPRTVLSTSETIPTYPKSWGKMTERSPKHNFWLIETDNPDLVRDARKIVRLDSSIDFPGKRLSDASSYHDALTKRIVCIEALNQSATSRRVSGVSILKLLDQLDWAIRWRNAQGIRRFSNLTQADHTNFLKQYGASGDLASLLPLDMRLQTLADDETYELPFRRHGIRFDLLWDPLAETLGLTRKSLSGSSSFRSLLESLLPRFVDRIGVPLERVLISTRPRGHRDGVQACRDVSRFIVWDVLERLSHGGYLQHDPISFTVPFMDRRKTIERTQTLLPRDFFNILSASTTWILEFGPHILRTLQARATHTGAKTNYSNRQSLRPLTEQINRDRPDGMPVLTLSAMGNFGDDGTLSLSGALAFLFVAAALLLGGFGARRHKEVYSARHGALRRVEHGLVFDFYIEKTLRDIDAVVVPEIIAKVVDCLDKLSKDARDLTGNRWLFQFHTAFADGQKFEVSALFEKHMNNFLQFTGVPPPNGMRQWLLKFHMLRKAFVISYYHGNLWGSFDGANRMLRHLGDVTRIYMDDARTGSILWLRNEVVRLTSIAKTELSVEQREHLAKAKDVLSNAEARTKEHEEGRQEFFVAKMMETYDGIERPVGLGGARMLDYLREMENKAYARIHVTAVPTNSPDGVRQSVLQQVTEAAKEEFMEPIPGIPGYCLFKRGTSEHEHIAACLRSKNQVSASSPERVKEKHPDYAFTSFHTCSSCELCAILKNNQAEIEKVGEEMAQEIKEERSSTLAASAQRYVDDIFSALNVARKAVDGKERT